MPCDSRIQTKMDNAENLEHALKDLGFSVEVKENGACIVGTRDRTFVQFRRTGGAFSVIEALTDRKVLSEISRKYAEVGVRSWASRRGFAVTENDGVRMTLVNRRG